MKNSLRSVLRDPDVSLIIKDMIDDKLSLLDGIILYPEMPSSARSGAQIYGSLLRLIDALSKECAYDLTAEKNEAARKYKLYGGKVKPEMERLVKELLKSMEEE